MAQLMYFLRIFLEIVLKLFFPVYYFVKSTYLTLQDPKTNISTTVSTTTVIRVLFVEGCFDSKPYSMVLPKEGVCTFGKNQSEVAATTVLTDIYMLYISTILNEWYIWALENSTFIFKVVLYLSSLR